MQQGRRVHDWGQTGSQLAMVANVNRPPRKRAYQVAEFVPRDLRKVFRVRRGIGLTKRSLHMLKALFDKSK